MTRPLTLAAIGVVFGFALSRIGFSSWDEVHRMFTLVDVRLYLTFATATALLAAAWRVLAVRGGFAPRELPIHRGSIVGGLVFGTGWALSGACPSIALVQVGEGQLAALVTLAGVLLGNYLYAPVHERWLRWPLPSCSSD